MPRTHALLFVLASTAVACGGDDSSTTSSGAGPTGGSTSDASGPTASDGSGSLGSGSSVGAASSEDASAGGTSSGGSSSGGSSSLGSSSGATGSGDTSGSSGASTGGDSTTGAIGPDADDLFTDAGLARVELTLDDAAIDGLWADSTSYVHADAHLELADGTTFDLLDIGVRLKGRYGSFRTLDQKAGFLLRFDEFDPGQQPLGLEKLALNNMVQDPSMVHEQLAYALFRAAGVPAPRTGYARVFVNDELYGLYALIEPADNNLFLDTWFGDHDQNLYEGAYGSDFYPGWGSSFDQDNGDDVGFADLEQLAGALDQMDTPETFLDDAGAVIDMPRYLQFAATEIFIGHWDGYAWTRNNYSVYRAVDARWTFIPWGTDQTFNDFLPIWGGQGRIEQMCGQSVPCREGLRDAFEDVIARIDVLALVDRVDALRALIDEAMQEDPRKEYDPGTVHAWMDWTKQFMVDRATDVVAQFDCADPSAVDEDGDGAWGCGFDCNDGDPNVYPGAPELCNVADDDCDGVLDDDPSCAQCQIVPADAGDHAWGFCFTALDYDGARASCQQQGGELAAIHGPAEQAELWSGATSLVYGSWWIGLDDRSVEGSFAWTDGTPLDYTQWAGGEPNNSGNEDCAHLADWAGGAWNDIPCANAMPFVCRLP